MKYFAPERWLRFQDPRDKQVFYSASEEWEQALKAYRRKLRQVLRESPSRLKYHLAVVSLLAADLVIHPGGMFRSVFGWQCGRVYQRGATKV